MNTTRRLGAVIVGTGFGVITHVRAMRDAGFEVLALIGRNPTKTSERAERAGIPLGLTSLDEALLLPGVDVVAVATPPHTHAEITLKAIAAGKHVVCEKPFARDAREAQAMLEAAQEKGVVNYLGTEHRWDSGQALVGQAIRDGLIGKPAFFTLLLQVPLLHADDSEVPDWWGDASEGGGWLGAYGSHQVDFALDLFGDFAGLSASLSVVSQHGWTADDTFTVHFRTESGVAGIMQSSCAALGQPLVHFRIAGTGGTLEMVGERVFVDDREGRRELALPEALRNDDPTPPDMGLMNTAYDKMHASGSDLAPYTKLYESFRADICGEPAPNPVRPATFADGVSMQTVLDAIRESSRRGGWVDIG